MLLSHQHPAVPSGHLVLPVDTPLGLCLARQLSAQEVPGAARASGSRMRLLPSRPLAGARAPTGRGGGFCLTVPVRPQAVSLLAYLESRSVPGCWPGLVHCLALLVFSLTLFKLLHPHWRAPLPPTSEGPLLSFPPHPERRPAPTQLPSSHTCSTGICTWHRIWPGCVHRCARGTCVQLYFLFRGFPCHLPCVSRRVAHVRRAECTVACVDGQQVQSVSDGVWLRVTCKRSPFGVGDTRVV